MAKTLCYHTIKRSRESTDRREEISNDELLLGQPWPSMLDAF